MGYHERWFIGFGSYRLLQNSRFVKCWICEFVSTLYTFFRSILKVNFTFLWGDHHKTTLDWAFWSRLIRICLTCLLRSQMKVLKVKICFWIHFANFMKVHFLVRHVFKKSWFNVTFSKRTRNKFFQKLVSHKN